MKKLQICIRYGFIINYINPPLLSLSLSLSLSLFLFFLSTGYRTYMSACLLGPLYPE